MAKRRKDKVQDETLVNVVEVKDSAQEYFEKNKTMITTVITALVLIVGAFVVYKFFIKEPAEQQAKMAIYKAEQQFARDSFALALENPGGGFEGFLDIIDNYKGTQTSNLAKLYAGISYLNLGRYDDAISYYEAHSANSLYSKIMKNGGLGDAYAELGDKEKAASYYDKAISAGSDDLMTPYFLFKGGLLAKNMENNAKAVEYFNRIKSDYPNSNEANNVDILIAKLSK